MEDVAAMAVAAQLLTSPRGKRARDDADVDSEEEEEEEVGNGNGKGARGGKRGGSAASLGRGASKRRRDDGGDGDNDFMTTTTTTTTNPEPRNVSLSVQSLLGVHSRLEPGQSHEDDTAEVGLPLSHSLPAPGGVRLVTWTVLAVINSCF
jgi:hypothetical protein